MARQRRTTWPVPCCKLDVRVNGSTFCGSVHTSMRCDVCGSESDFDRRPSPPSDGERVSEGRVRGWSVLSGNFLWDHPAIKIVDVERVGKQAQQKAEKHHARRPQPAEFAEAINRRDPQH